MAKNLVGVERAVLELCQNVFRIHRRACATPILEVYAENLSVRKVENSFRSKATRDRI